MKKMIMTMGICLLLYVTGISAFAQNTEWQCDNCDKFNEYDYNFCGNCGSKKPKEDWTCEACGKINQPENSFCGNCGIERGTTYKQSAYLKGEFGKQILYNGGYIYVAGNDGIFRINFQNEYEYILENDAYTDAFFAVNGNLYFVKYGFGSAQDAYLCQYDPSTNKLSELCASGFYGRIVGADGDNIYFLQNENKDGWGNQFVVYNVESKKKTVLEEHVGTAYFWNGRILYADYASDVSPVAIHMIDEDGSRKLITEKGSQNLYVDDEQVCYIEYKMTSGITWEKVSVNRITGNDIAELADFSGKYIMPFIHGKINDDLLVSCFYDNKTQYYQIATAGSEPQIYEMDLPEDATYMSLFQDEHGNCYYYANHKVFCWKGAGYECVAEIPAAVSVVGVMGGYVFYYAYSPENKPKLFQIKCRWW